MTEDNSHRQRNCLHLRLFSEMNANTIMFIALTTLQIPSLLCIVYILVHYTQRRSPLRRLQNHLLMYLLIVAAWTVVIELPNTQKYLWTNSASFHEYWFCSFWNISFVTTATLNRILMAIMSIERHFLVFCPQLYRARRKRLVFHYIPIISIVTITVIYLIVTNLAVTCSRLRYNYSLFMCGYSCAALARIYSNIYTWASIFTPTFTTVIACLLLPVRFILQKRQLQQIDWHRTRTMIVPTTAIASIYTICWLPYTIILQLLTNNALSYFNGDIIRYLTIVPYMTSLLTPFIVYHTVRRATDMGIIQRLKCFLFWKRQVTVEPARNCVARPINRGTINAQNSTRT